MFNFNIFKSSPAEAQSEERSWNPDTVAMQQPTSPAAPSTNQNVVSEQPTRQEDMQLRGGNGGGLCCGICAGIACFECCEICC